jgi:hypothetical protein
LGTAARRGVVVTRQCEIVVQFPGGHQLAVWLKHECGRRFGTTEVGKHEAAGAEARVDIPIRVVARQGEIAVRSRRDHQLAVRLKHECGLKSDYCGPSETAEAEVGKHEAADAEARIEIPSEL